MDLNEMHKKIIADYSVPVPDLGTVLEEAAQLEQRRIEEMKNLIKANSIVVPPLEELLSDHSVPSTETPEALETTIPHLDVNNLKVEKLLKDTEKAIQEILNKANDS